MSRILIRIVIFILDILVKIFKIKIRVYNIDNIPEDEPVMFVSNHFTRIETVFIPYVLYKHNRKLSLSLAHYSFFSGWFGKFMNMVGALSTKDEHRDKILVEGLLKNTNYSIIFPEGQMIKDKKVLKGSEIMIYNDGKRRPPHKGSGLIALQSQLFREKLEYYRENGYTEELNELKKYFKIKNKNLNNIISKRSVIVPMNVTFYPLRPKENKLKNFIMKKIGELPERFEEEISVESSILTQGADVCINFGEPIYINNYLKEEETRKEIINTSLNPNSDKESFSFLKDTSKKLMYDYMAGIYSLTTVTSDHIFAYYLHTNQGTELDEDVFKDACYASLIKIRKEKKVNLHRKLRYIDISYKDFLKLYEEFFESLNGNVKRKEGRIIYKGKTTSCDFHSIRQKKIIEVLHNEIEYLCKFMDIL